MLHSYFWPHLYFQVRFVVELPPDGYLLTSFRMYTLRVMLYATTSDYWRAVGEAIIALGTFYYLCESQFLRAAPRRDLLYFACLVY